MKCVKCGVELSDGAKFCEKCGAPQPQPVFRPQSIQPAAAPQSEADNAGNIFAVGSIMFAVLWILGTILHLTLYKYLRE